MSTFTSADASAPAFVDAVTNLIEAKTYNWIGDMNASFVLTSGYLVFFMQVGFALITIGGVRAKSAKSVALKNVMDAAFGACGYFLFGWALAYGDSTDAEGNDTNNPFLGTVQFAMSNIPEDKYNTWLFQYVFAISTATIVSGAVAERVTFVSYALYAFFLTSWVYPVLTHWLWTSSGWASTTRTTGPLLLGAGAYDTVGSGAVHMVGGVAGLMGAWIAGPRVGRFDANGKPREMPGHNHVYFMMGTIFLWFGFYGFNPGTMGQIVAPDGSSFSMVVARCAISTSLGAGFGGATALIIYLFYSKFVLGHLVWDLTSACNGALTGMVVITSGCATYTSWGAALGGIFGGCIVLPSSLFVLHVLRIDDPIDAITVHMSGGAVGVWYMSLMSYQPYVYELYGSTYPDGSARHYGWWTGDDATQFAANTIWVCVIFGWVAVMMGPFFYILKLMGLLRISDEEQLVGIDVSHHGGHAYPGMESAFVDPQFEEASFHKASPGDLSNGKAIPTSFINSMEVDKLRLELESMSDRLRALEANTNGASNGVH